MIRWWHHYRNERHVWRLITLYHMERVFGAGTAQRVRQRTLRQRSSGESGLSEQSTN